MKAPHACSLFKVDLSLHPEHSCKKPGLAMCSHTPWFVLGVQWPTSLAEMASFWVTETPCQGTKIKSHRERHQTFFSNLCVYREECTHSHIHAHTHKHTHIPQRKRKVNINRPLYTIKVCTLQLSQMSQLCSVCLWQMSRHRWTQGSFIELWKWEQSQVQVKHSGDTHGILQINDISINRYVVHNMQ